MSARLDALAAAIGARRIGADRDYAGAGIDTRTLAAGELFFALPGAYVDGHDFVSAAAERGAAAAVVARPVDADLTQLVVDDVAAALTAAGAHARNGYGGTLAAITGSNGKTTVKQMLAAICGAAGPALATRGNLNNHLGVPLTLLRLGDQARAVVEMGASHAGEIAALCDLARPRVGAVTNAGAAHLEGFGSLEGVARAKGEMFSHLPADGIAVINADDDYAALWRELAGSRRQLSFGVRAQADVTACDIELDDHASAFTLVMPDGQARLCLPLAGRHNVINALAAAACAYATAIDIQTIVGALTGMQPVAGRLAVTAARHGARLVDDSYNANPGSLTVALDWLAAQPGPRWVVLGDMAELGAHAETSHREAGRAARAAGVERLWVTGGQTRAAAAAFGAGGQWFVDHDALNAALTGALAEADNRGAIVLVKGSRSARMDRVADALRLESQSRAGVPC